MKECGGLNGAIEERGFNNIKFKFIFNYKKLKIKSKSNWKKTGIVNDKHHSNKSVTTNVFTGVLLELVQ